MNDRMIKFVGLLQQTVSKIEVKFIALARPKRRGDTRIDDDSKCEFYKQKETPYTVDESISHLKY